ncbi:MAG: hypothetical protein V9F00_11680 [Nocardioides sp.]
MSNDQRRREHHAPQRREPDPDYSQTSLTLEAVELDNGWDMAETVNPDGTVSLWLLSPGGDTAPAGCACQDCAPHERLGVKCLPTICGAPCKTKGGQPCQTRTRLGEHCTAHRHQTSG